MYQEKFLHIHNEEKKISWTLLTTMEKVAQPHSLQKTSDKITTFSKALASLPGTLYQHFGSPLKTFLKKYKTNEHFNYCHNKGIEEATSSHKTKSNNSKSNTELYSKQERDAYI